MDRINLNKCLGEALSKIAHPPAPLADDTASMKLARWYWDLDRSARAHLRRAAEHEIQTNKYGNDCREAERYERGRADATFLARDQIPGIAALMYISTAEWEQAWRQAQPED